MDAEKLISDPEVNIVYIATPPGTHCEYALRVAAAGKACYVEKPMARTHGECQRMVEAFASRNLPLYVAYYRRSMERFVRARQLIDAGELGTISGMAYRMARPAHRRGAPGWRVDLAVAGAGLFLDIGSHTLDLLDYLVGPLEEVSGVARQMSGNTRTVEDSVAISFVAGGAPGMASWNFATEGELDLLEIHGTEGALSLSTFGDDPVRLVRAGNLREYPFSRPPHAHAGLVASIVTELTTGCPVCPSTGESAARTSKVMDVVLQSFYGPRDSLFPATS